MDVFEHVALCHLIQETMENEQLSAEKLADTFAPGPTPDGLGLQEDVDYVDRGVMPVALQRVGALVKTLAASIGAAQNEEERLSLARAFGFVDATWAQMIEQELPLSEHMDTRVLLWGWQIIEVTNVVKDMLIGAYEETTVLDASPPPPGVLIN